MDYKKFYILIEGDDDERFFKQIIIPKLQKKYDLIETYHYAVRKKKDIDNFLKSIKAMGADYIYITDINNSLCVIAKKNKKKSKLKNVDEENIIVVIKEIEGWYLAGLSNTTAEKFKMSTFIDTDTITKEQFNNFIPEIFDSRIDFQLEILKNFSIEIA